MTSTENDGGDNQRWDREKRERIAVGSDGGGATIVCDDDDTHIVGDDHHNYNDPAMHSINPNSVSDPKTRDPHIVDNHKCDRNTIATNCRRANVVWLLGKSVQNHDAVWTSNVDAQSMRVFVSRCQRVVGLKCVNRLAALRAHSTDYQATQCSSINRIGRRTSDDDKGKRTAFAGHVNSRLLSASRSPPPTPPNKLRQQSTAIIYNDKLRLSQQQQQSTPKRNSVGACYISSSQHRRPPQFHSTAGGAASTFIVGADDVLVDDDVYPSSHRQTCCMVVKRRSSRQRSTFSCLNELVKMYSARVKHIKKQLAAEDRNSSDFGRSTDVGPRNCVDGQVVLATNTDRSVGYDGDNDVAHGSGHQDRHHQQPNCDVSCRQCSDGGSDKAHKGNRVMTTDEAPYVIENTNTKCRCGSGRNLSTDNTVKPPHYRDVDTNDERVCSDYDEVDNNSVKIRHNAQWVPSDTVVASPVSVDLPQYKISSGKCNLFHTIVSAQSVTTTTNTMHTKDDGNNQYFSGVRRHSEHTVGQNEHLGSTNTNQLRIQCGDRLAMSCSPTSDEGCPNHVSPYSSSSEDEDKARCRRDTELNRSREKVARSSSSDSALGLDDDGIAGQADVAVIRPTRRMTLTVMDLPLRPALLPVAEPTNLSDSQPQLITCDDSPLIVPTKLLLEAQIIEISSVSTSLENSRRFSRPDGQTASTENNIDNCDPPIGPRRFVRTPSVVVSDYSDDLVCGGITLEEIEFFRQQRQSQRRSSAQAGCVDYDSDLSTASSCSNLNYCGSTISAMDAEEMYATTASGLLTPERKISDCSTCSTVSAEEDTFPMRLSEALKDQKKKVGRIGS